MKWRNMLPQLVLGALVVLGVAIPQAQANSIWNYSGSGDGHTVTGFLELDFDIPVGAPTGFNFPGATNTVLNSEFTISGPNFGGSATVAGFTTGSFTFHHNDFIDATGWVTPPDNLGCVGGLDSGCFWAYLGGMTTLGQQVLSATIFNGDDWQVDAFFAGIEVAALSNGPGIDDIFGEFQLRGTGQWTPQTSGSNPVPEPSTMLLLGSGLVGLVGWQMRKKKA